VAGVFFISSIHGLLALLVNHGYQCVGALRLDGIVGCFAVCCEALSTASSRCSSTMAINGSARCALMGLRVVLLFAAKDRLGSPRDTFHGLLALLVNHGYQCVGALRLDSPSELSNPDWNGRSPDSRRLSTLTFVAWD